jgi:hypothetical protein
VTALAGDDTQIEKGAKFLSDRWLALEQNTKHHHQQIDQMKKMLHLIKSEKSMLPAKSKSSIRGGLKIFSLLEVIDAPTTDDRSRPAQLRFSGSVNFIHGQHHCLRGHI